MFPPGLVKRALRTTMQMDSLLVKSTSEKVRWSWLWADHLATRSLEILDVPEWVKQLYRDAFEKHSDFLVFAPSSSLFHFPSMNSLLCCIILRYDLIFSPILKQYVGLVLAVCSEVTWYDKEFCPSMQKLLY